MKIAVPTNAGTLSMHFGHCEKFAIVDADVEKKEIMNTEYIEPPAHEPGALPKWLSAQNVKIVIAGGMGSRAQQLFSQFGIDSLVGVPGGSPEEIVKAYLNGELEAGNNVCDH